MGSQETMKAVFLLEAGKTEVREVPVPQPGPDEVLVEVHSVGVCGSDVHYFKHGRLGKYVVEEPLILGHECAGRVAKVGGDVTSLQAGDRVALEPGIPCRRCQHCRRGRYNLCQDVRFMATPPVHGAFCEYVLSPADFTYKLPDDVSTEEGAMVEPLAVGCHGIRRARLEPGERVAVLGAGPIGLLAIAAASAAGAGEILAVDLVKAKLDLARKMGATHTVNVTEEGPEEFLSPDRFGSWADVTLDCVGVHPSYPQNIEVTAAGGRVVWIGMGCDAAEVPVMQVLNKELTIYGIFRYANVFEEAIRLLATERIVPIPLITHRFEFPDVQGALELGASEAETAVKTMVNFPAMLD